MRDLFVSGALANKPWNGGNAWVILSWLRGFKRLGFDAHFVEQISEENCFDRWGAATAFENSVNCSYFEQIIRQFGLLDCSTLIYQDGAQTVGMGMAELIERAGAAELLVNISGHLEYAPLLGRFKRRVYLDLDPGFTQFWHALGKRGSRLQGHDLFFTIGENIGSPGCTIPTCGIPWRPVRQPIVMDDWPVASGGSPDLFTTIGSWRGPFGPVTYDGRTFGLKVHEFRKFIGLPERVPQAFELALDIHSSETPDRDSLRLHGWRLVDPKTAVPGPQEFRRYVQNSAAEFSAAQGIYVETQSGWLSDRTLRYLASGKPALVQDTGFGSNYPVGEGLLVFRTLDQAVEGVERITRDYSHHSHAARTLAEEYFDSDKVLGHLLEQVADGG